MTFRTLRILTFSFLGLISLGFSVAQAAGFDDPCHVSGKIILSKSTSINCVNSDALHFAANTVIITNGYKLTIFTTKNVEFNNLVIRAYEEDHSEKSDHAGTISIAGLTAIGGVSIFNDGLGEEGMSGDVYLSFLSADSSFKKRVVLDASEAKYTGI